jgi:hypothetical protein
MVKIEKDHMVFVNEQDPKVPPNFNLLAIELVGDGVDTDIVCNAASALVFYYQEELGRSHVSIKEFGRALTKTLGKLGYGVRIKDEFIDSDWFSLWCHMQC